MSAACCSPEKLLLALLLALLPACAAVTREPTDHVEIVWNRIDDPQKTCEQLSGRPEFFRILGCSKWRDSGKPDVRTCAIYAPMPRDEHDTARMATLGHELMHCFDGNWHDRWGHMNDDYRQQAAAGGTKEKN
jgi:hypothetical protein